MTTLSAVAAVGQGRKEAKKGCQSISINTPRRECSTGQAVEHQQHMGPHLPECGEGRAETLVSVRALRTLAGQRVQARQAKSLASTLRAHSSMLASNAARLGCSLPARASRGEPRQGCLDAHPCRAPHRPRSKRTRGAVRTLAAIQSPSAAGASGSGLADFEDFVLQWQTKLCDTFEKADGAFFHRCALEPLSIDADRSSTMTPPLTC